MERMDSPQARHRDRTDAPNRTLVNGLRLLEFMAGSDRPYSVAELAREFSLPKSHVHRLLQTLVALGYVRRPRDSRLYAVDVQVFALAAALADHHPLRVAAGPTLRWLAGHGQAATLCVWHRDRPMSLAHDTRDGVPLPGFSLGRFFHVHASATGKLFAALLRVDPVALERITPNTITTRRGWLAEARRIRRDDLAVNRCENNVTAWSFAVPIRSAQGELLAAVGLRVAREAAEANEQHYPPLVTEAAARIESALASRAHTAEQSA